MEALICSDPLVMPSSHASTRTRELWCLHGHPHSKRYQDLKLVSLAALVRHAGSRYKGKRAFLYPSASVLSTKKSSRAENDLTLPVSPSKYTTYEDMSWDEFDIITEILASIYADQLQEELRAANVTQRQPTVALLGNGRTIDYFCTQLALQKLGVRVLLLAESNSLDAINYLLKNCDVATIIFDFDSAHVTSISQRRIKMAEVVAEMLDSVRENGDISTQLLPIQKKVDSCKFLDFSDVWERHSFILHSSGSTGMPKLVIHTNRSMMLIARMYRLFQDFHIENWFLLFPLYHIAGISIALSGLPNGLRLSFPPRTWPPSSSSIFAAWKHLSEIGDPVDCVHCAPTLIENMYEYISENGVDFSPLAALKIVQPGGAALSESIVKVLVANGVNVKTTYGSTEIGPPFRSCPHNRSNAKCYSFRNLYPDNSFIKMEDMGDGTYECVVYKGFELAAELWEGPESANPYRTNDIFIQDPPESGFYVLQGRRDDVLVHSNGENTNAGSLQLDIETCSKLIKHVLVVGHAQPCVGVLIELQEGNDPNSAAIQDMIWTNIEGVNDKYSGHSRVLKSMIYILPKTVVLPVTPKGNVKRKEAERLFSSYIDMLYSDVLTESLHGVVDPSEGLSEFIRHLVSRLSSVPVSEVKDWTSFYLLQIDSLKALQLRASISSRMGHSISLSAIFENPSVEQLTTYLESQKHKSRALTKTESTHSRVTSIRSRSFAIDQIISKLSSEFETWASRPKAAYKSVSSDIVLMTGSSGSLGTELLEALSRSDNVSKIYAMMRGPNHKERLVSSLRRRGISTEMLEGGKIEILNFSMQDPLLGLDVGKYHELAESVTVVVQGAWKMDFNMGVEEFESDCLRNTMHMLRFCYAGRPKTFAFTGSFSACLGRSQVSPVQEIPLDDDSSAALPTGYAQSKYIVERLTQIASSQLAIPTRILRIGQMAGSTRTGQWNTNEMWPILIATSIHPKMNAFPRLDWKLVDWIPVDIVASVISEIMASRSQDMYTVHNIVNPHPIPWSALISMLNISTLFPASPSQPSAQRIAEIDMEEWVKRLNAIASAHTGPGAHDLVDDVPGLRLLTVFEMMASGDEEEPKVFDTSATRRLSAALRDCAPFCRDWLELSIKSWRAEAFL